jgi:hypothetical protein
MAKVFELIQATSVGAGGASSIDFLSIPNTYTDLMIEVSGRTTNWGYSYNNLYLSINGTPTGSAYSDKVLFAVGSTTGSFNQSATSQFLIGATPSTAGTANTFSNCSVYLTNYNSSAYKIYQADGVSERNNTTNGDIFLSMIGGEWASTSAITSLYLTSDSSNFVQYTTAYLYGIKSS